MKSVPESHRDILEKPSFAHFATLMSDGSPHSAPVWIDNDGRHLLVNSAEGRVKDRNVRRDPRVALSVTDPDNPYRSIAIRGKVVKIENEGADEHIDKLAKRYLGVDSYPYRTADEVRVIYFIEPEKISTTP